MALCSGGGPSFHGRKEGDSPSCSVFAAEPVLAGRGGVRHSGSVPLFSQCTTRSTTPSTRQDIASNLRDRAMAAALTRVQLSSHTVPAGESAVLDRRRHRWLPQWHMHSTNNEPSLLRARDASRCRHIAMSPLDYHDRLHNVEFSPNFQALSGMGKPCYK